MAHAEASPIKKAFQSLEHCIEFALNGVGAKTAAKIFIGIEVEKHLNGLKEAWAKQDKTAVQEEIIALGNVFINARTHGVFGLQMAQIETFLAMSRAFDENAPKSFEAVELKVIQAIEARAQPLIDLLADTAFNLLHPEAARDQAEAARNGPAPEAPAGNVAPPPAGQAGAPMQFDPVIIRRGGAMTFAPTVVTMDDAPAGPNTVFEPMVVTMDDAIAGPDTVFEPMVVTRDDAIAGPDTIFEPMVVTMDAAIAGPTTQFDIDVVDSGQYMTIPPSEGMYIDSLSQGANAPETIPEQLLSDTPGYSDTPDISALQVPAVDVTGVDLGAGVDAAGYMGGDLGLASNLDYGFASGAGGDFGIGFLGMDGGFALDPGGMPGDPGGGWSGDGGGAGA